MMKYNWGKIRLGDVCLTNINTYSSRDQWDFVNYLDTGNITSNCIDSIQHIDIKTEKLPSRAKRKVNYNNIIYSTVRPNQRHYGIIKEQPENFLVSTGFTVIEVDSDKVDADYLYFLLSSDSITESLSAIAEQSTSAYPSIKPSDIENLEILLPTLSEQKQIACILKALDDKIALNQQINKNLEEQAQAIYEEMFGDSLIDGFRVGELSEIADITMGQSPKGDTYNEYGDGTVFYQGRAEFGFRFPTQRLFTTEPKRMARENDVLMSVRAPVGDINVARENCCIGRGLASIRSKFGHQSFVLYTMFNLRNQIDIFNGEGTVFGSINRDALNSLPVQIPSAEQIEQFEKIVAPMDSSIRSNHEELCRLETLRDALLPRLMSGEIDVSGIEI